MDNKDYVIFYGTERWSAYFFLDEEKYNELNTSTLELMNYLQQRVQYEVMSNPDMIEKVLWAEVYKLQEKIHYVKIER